MKRLTIYDKNNPPPASTTSLPSPVTKNIQVSGEAKSTPKVIYEYNEGNINHTFAASSAQIEVINSTSLSSQPHRYMHVKQQEKCAILNAQLDEFAERAAKYLGMSMDEFGNPSLPTPSPITVVGRIIINNNNGSIEEGNTVTKEDSILLECSRQMGSGCRVLLEFDSAKESFCLFPGALVVLQGISHPNRSSFQPFKQLPVHSLFNSPSASSAAPFKMIAAAGPYFMHSNNNSNAPFTPSQDMIPFEKLLNFVNEQRPNVLLLMGPFVDAEHPAFLQGNMKESILPPEELFIKEFIQRRLGILTSRNPSLRVLLVPSTRDLFTDPILPTPVPNLSTLLSGSITMHSNPLNLRINNIPITILNSDILLSLGMGEVVINNNSAGGADRFSRLSRHLIEQGNLWPLHPSPPHTNLDYTRLDELKIGPTPTLLITPSQLKSFVRTVSTSSSSHVTVLNPGLYCRPAAYGTAAIVTFEGDQRRIDLVQF